MISKYRRSRAAQQAGQVLILSLLVVIVIILILWKWQASKVAGRNEYNAQGNVQGAATPEDRAYDAACTEYQSQVAQAAGMYRSDHNAPPPDLESLKKYGVTEEMINTPNCAFGFPKNAATAAPPTSSGPSSAPPPGAYSVQPPAPSAASQPGNARPGTTTLVGPGGMPVHVPNSGGAGAAAGYGGGGDGTE